MQKTASSINHMINGKIFPSDDTMIKIAKLAGVDVGQALLDLCILRNQGAAKSEWKELLKRLSSLFPATLFGAVSLETSAAHAANFEVISSTPLPFAAATGIAAVCITKRICNVYYGNQSLYNYKRP